MRAVHLLLTAVVAATLAGCGRAPGANTPAPNDEMIVVGVTAVSSQPCDRPNHRLGTGTVLSDGSILTAGHVVDGATRDVLVGGLDATVVAVDDRRDLAVLEVDGDTDVGSVTRRVDPVDSDGLRIATPDGTIDAVLVRTVGLDVDDVSAGTLHHRRAHVVEPAVEGGLSGAPLVDPAGGLLGVVILAGRSAGFSYAVTADEVASLLVEIGARAGGEALAPHRGCA